jgi:hypothetical protein
VTFFKKIISSIVDLLEQRTGEEFDYLKTEKLFNIFKVIYFILLTTFCFLIIVVSKENINMLSFGIFLLIIASIGSVFEIIYEHILYKNSKEMKLELLREPSYLKQGEMQYKLEGCKVVSYIEWNILKKKKIGDVVKVFGIKHPTKDSVRHFKNDSILMVEDKIIFMILTFTFWLFMPLFGL